MKKQYQITKRRTAEQFEQWVKTNEVPIQLTTPTAAPRYSSASAQISSI